MKIYIPTKGHVPRMSTIKTLKKLGQLENATFFVHNDEQRKALSAEVSKKQIVVHGIPVAIDALTDVRDWVEKNHIDRGDWYIGMDDNVQYLQRVTDQHYDKEKAPGKRDCYREPVESFFFKKMMEELTDKCDRHVTSYGGFGWHENPFFRKKKWQYWGYCKAKLYVKRAQEIKWRWDPRIRLMNDHALSFKTVAEEGRVYINQFIYVHHERWQAGGLGSHEYRLPMRNATCKFLYEKFEGLVAPRKEEYDNPALRKHTEKSINRWRSENGYL